MHTEQLCMAIHFLYNTYEKCKMQFSHELCITEINVLILLGKIII